MRMIFGILAIFLASTNCEVYGRAVSIHNVWILPEEGFPVFYRYFRDRISWYEADAVCQFHHGNLVTVDSTAQYDAVRAYLKELDIIVNVWIGLIKTTPEGHFSWANYQRLSGDGYWRAAPVESVAPLCAAADPAADYRWDALACGGPEIASFVCELPVPSWALQEDSGCMMHALPALTATYLPGSAAIQLTADCGLAGVKKVMCTGNHSREDLLKELSCGITYEEFLENSTLKPTILHDKSTKYPLKYTTEYKQITEGNIQQNYSNLKESILQQSIATTDFIPTDFMNANKSKIHDVPELPVKQSNPYHITSKEILEIKPTTITNERNNLATINSLVYNNSVKTLEIVQENNETESPENTNIFTQSSDHFIPPLVMAKSKASTDMTVVSINEKHAQQNMLKHKISNITDNNLPTKIIETTSTTKKEFVMSSPIPSPSEKIEQNIASSSVTQAIEAKEITTEKPKKEKKYNDIKDNPKSKYNYKKPLLINNSKFIKMFNTVKKDINDKTTDKFTTTPNLIEVMQEVTNPIKMKNDNDSELHNMEMLPININILRNQSEKNDTIENSAPVKDNKTVINSVIATETNAYNKINDADELVTTECGNVTEIFIESKPKPNRSRNLTPSPHRSFYPYFINRVLG